MVYVLHSLYLVLLFTFILEITVFTCSGSVRLHSRAICLSCCTSVFIEVSALPLFWASKAYCRVSSEFKIGSNLFEIGCLKPV